IQQFRVGPAEYHADRLWKIHSAPQHDAPVTARFRASPASPNPNGCRYSVFQQPVQLILLRLEPKLERVFGHSGTAADARPVARHHGWSVTSGLERHDEADPRDARRAHHRGTY